MAYYLQGQVNAYVSIPTIIIGANTDFTITIDFDTKDLTAAATQAIMGKTGTFAHYLWKDSSNRLSTSLAGINTVSTFTFSSYKRYKLVLTKIGTNLTITANNEVIINATYSTTSNIEFDRISAAANNLYQSQFKFYSIRIDAGATQHLYDSSASNGAGNILIDTISANNGTLVGFPIDNSQWVAYELGVSNVGLGWPVQDRSFDSLIEWYTAKISSPIFEEAICNGDLGSGILDIASLPNGGWIHGPVVFDGSNGASLPKFNGNMRVRNSGVDISVEDIWVDNTTGNGIALELYSGSNRVARRCLVTSAFSSGSVTTALGVNFGAVAEKCVVISTSASLRQTVRVNAGVIRDVTIVGGTSAITVIDTNISTITDTLAINGSTRDFNILNPSVSTLTNIASSDLSAGVHTGFSTADLVDFAGGDYRIKQDSPLRELGIGAFFQNIVTSRVGLGWPVEERDYTTLNLWVAARSNTIEIEDALCRGISTAANTRVDILSGFQFGATIRGEVEYDGSNQADLPTIQYTITLTAPNILVQDFNITTTNKFLIAATSSHPLSGFLRCRIFSNIEGGAPSILLNSAALGGSGFNGGFAKKCIISTTGIATTQGGYYNGFLYDQCVIFGGSTYNIHRVDNPIIQIVSNTFSLLSGRDFIDENVNSASHDATGTYKGYTTDEFVDFANNNFRIKLGSDLDKLQVGSFFESDTIINTFTTGKNIDEILWGRKVQIFRGAGDKYLFNRYVARITEVSLPLEIFSLAEVDGQDIRVSLNSDGTNALPLHIEKFDPNTNTATLYVRLPELNLDQSFWIFYNRPGYLKESDDSLIGSKAVWSNALYASTNATNNIVGATPIINELTGVPVYSDTGVRLPTGTTISYNADNSTMNTTETGSFVAEITVYSATTADFLMSIGSFVNGGIDVRTGASNATAISIFKNDTSGDLSVTTAVNSYALGQRFVVYGSYNQNTTLTVSTDNLALEASVDSTTTFKAISDNIFFGAAADVDMEIHSFYVYNSRLSEEFINTDSLAYANPVGFWTAAEPVDTFLVDLDVTLWQRRAQLTGLAPSNDLDGFTTLITGENLPDEIWERANPSTNYLLNTNDASRILTSQPVTLSNVGDYIEFSGFASAGNQDDIYRIVGTSNAFVSFIEMQPGSVVFRPNGESSQIAFSVNYTQPAVGQDFVLKIIKIDVNRWECFVNGVSLGNIIDAANFTFNQFMNFSVGQEFGFLGGLYYVKASSNGGQSVTNHWTAARSSDTSFVDIVGGNDGQLIGFNPRFNPMRFDGIDDYANVDISTTGDDWELEFKLDATSVPDFTGSHRVLGGSTTDAVTSRIFLLPNNNRITVATEGFSVDFTFLTYEIDDVFKITQKNDTLTLLINGEQQAGTARFNTNTILNSKFLGVNSDIYSGLALEYIKFIDNTNATNNRYYDVYSSTVGTTTLTDKYGKGFTHATLEGGLVIPSRITPNYYLTENGGGDIRFVLDREGERALPIDLIKFDTNKREALIWTRFPLYSNSLRSLWMLYGRTGLQQPEASDYLGASAVWGDRYQRFNLQETSGLIAEDSTGNSDGVYVSPSPMIGPNGGQLFLNTNDSRVIIGNSATVNLNKFAFSAFIKTGTANGVRNIISSDMGLAGDRNWQFRLEADGRLGITLWDDQGNAFISGSGTTVIPFDTIAKVDFTFNGTTYKTYVNGVEDLSFTDSTLIKRSLADYYIGAKQNASEEDFDGEIFDAEVWAGFTKSSDYIEAEYVNKSIPEFFWNIDVVEGTITPDTVKPIITVTGDEPTFIDQFEEVPVFIATATDVYLDEENPTDISDRIVVTGTVNINLAGTYQLRYNVVDDGGNAADEFIRTVVVNDITKPVISVTGPLVQTIAQFAPTPTFVYAATDNFDGDITGNVVVTGSIDTNTIGAYVLRYNATDAAGNIATEVTRTVNVRDVTAPVILVDGVEGNQTVEINEGDPTPTFVVTANDFVDGDVTSRIVVTGGVDPSIAGTYVLRWNVTDLTGNAATEVTRTIIVNDATPPSLTVGGAAVTNINEGDPLPTFFLESFDTEEGNLTDQIVVSGYDTIDTNVAGTYIVTFNVADSRGNAAPEVTRTITVNDITKPVITIDGNQTNVIWQGGTVPTFVATAVDNVDGDISANIVYGSNVNVNVPGTYTLSYNVQDDAGNVADEVTRTIIVNDLQVPIIFGIGDDVTEIDEFDPLPVFNVTALDNQDGDITGSIVQGGDFNANTAIAGTYVLTWDVTDSQGNAAVQFVRTVVVNDITPPVITADGSAVTEVNQFANTPVFNPVAIDNVDGDISNQIVTTGTVNMSVVGTYVISYNVSDAAGNAAQTLTRTVVVKDATPPVLTVSGELVTEIFQKDPIPVFTARAIDAVEGDISSRIVVSGSVNNLVIGEYILRFNVSDSSGNAAPQISRVVRVLESKVKTVVTSQAPDAKPVARSLKLTSDWQTLIDVPNYEVPELVFGGSTTIEQGVGEVISPLICCNTTASMVVVDVRVFRYTKNITYFFVKGLKVPAYDMIPIPMNGQFFKTGDLLEIRASADNAVHAILSFTLGQSEEDDV